jgi:hypothetical protein
MNERQRSEMNTIAASIGKIILLWGAIESCLSAITTCLLVPTNNPPHNDGVPVSFSKKITLLKRCYRDNPKMSPIKDDARKLLIELNPMHETRVIVSHGNYQGILADGRHMFIAYHGGRSKKHG